MERTGEVTALRGEFLEITFCRPADCEKCNACRGGQKTTKLVIRGKASVGDSAVVEMPTATLMQATGVAYGLPLAGMFLGLFVGGALTPNSVDVGAAVGAGVGLVIAAGIVKLTEAKRRGNPKWQPRLVKIIPKQED